MIYIEILNCLNSKRFKAIFSMMFGIIIIAFLFTCKKYYNADIMNVRSATEMSFIQGIPSGYFKVLFIMILPLSASFVYSDSFYIEKRSGVYKSIITRVDKKKYLVSKLISIAVVVFFSVFITLLLNEILTYITFPIKGFDNNYGRAAFDINYGNYTKDYFLDLLRLSNPYLYNMSFILINSIFAAIMAMLSYSLTIIMDINRLAIFIAVLLLNMSIYIVFSLLGLSQFTMNSYLAPGSMGSILICLITLLSFLIITLGIFYFGMRKEIL